STARSTIPLHDDLPISSASAPQQPLADLRMLGLSVRVMPLLRREVQMSDITLNGLNLTLTRDENGTGNWEGIGQPPQQQDQTARSEEHTSELQSRENIV